MLTAMRCSRYFSSLFHFFFFRSITFPFYAPVSIICKSNSQSFHSSDSCTMHVPHGGYELWIFKRFLCVDNCVYAVIIINKRWCEFLELICIWMILFTVYSHTLLAFVFNCKSLKRNRCFNIESFHWYDYFNCLRFLKI